MGFGIIRQLVVVTDGHANQGCSPVDAARMIAARGITVSAVGILDGGHLGERGRDEVEAIAAAGGGSANCVETADLSRTLWSVTWQATQCTLNAMINRELHKIAGITWTELPPEKRKGIIELTAGLADQTELQLILLLDTSASMAGKMAALSSSVKDLMVALQEREGETYISAAGYPGREQVIKTLFPKSDRLFSWEELRPEGRTPTGPALLQACKLMFRSPELLRNTDEHTRLDVII